MEIVLHVRVILRVIIVRSAFQAILVMQQGVIATKAEADDPSTGAAVNMVDMVDIRRRRVRHFIFLSARGSAATGLKSIHNTRLF
jgi:hypothetical protein